MISLASVNGPSVTSAAPPVSSTRRRRPRWARGPAVSSSAPARVASSPSCMIASIRSARRRGGRLGCRAAASGSASQDPLSAEWRFRRCGRCGRPARLSQPQDSTTPATNGSVAARRAGGDAGERGQERDPGHPGASAQPRRPAGGEPPAQHEAGGDQARKPIAAGGQVQRAVPAHGAAGRPACRPGSRATGSAREHAGRGQAGAVHGEQPRRPAGRRRRRRQPDRAGERP